MTWEERDYTRRIRRAGKLWTERQGFWLMGTCQYIDGSTVSQSRCRQDARYFFSMLDRNILCRELIREGIKLPRLVFLETGKSRENTHLHFFVMGYEWEQYKDIRNLAEELWSSKIARARDCVVKDNMGSKDDRSGYGWKEFRRREDESLLTECCFLPHCDNT
jgi:hypothetical protein